MPAAKRYSGILAGFTEHQLKKAMADDEKRKALLDFIRQREPALHYKPGPTAKDFLHSRAPWRLIFAGNQVGKTTALIADCAMILKNCHPIRKRHMPVRLLALVPSRQQCAAVWGARLLSACELQGDIGRHPWIHDHEILTVERDASTRAPKKIMMRDGSSVLFALSGDKNSWKRLEGITFDYVYRDEADGNENLGDELNPRLLKAQTLRGSNPDHWWLGGMAWGFTKTKVNEEASAFHQRCVDGVDGHEMFLPDATLQAENPAVSVVQRMAMADRLSEDQFNLRALGTATAESILQIFPEVDPDRHIVPDHDATDEDNIWFGWDPGITDRFGLVAFCTRREYPQTIHILDWFTERHRTLDYQAQIIANYLQGRRIEGIIADQSSKRRDYTKGTPIISQFMEILRDQLRVEFERGHLIGKSLIPETVAMVKRYLDPDPGDKTCRPLVVCNKRAAGFMDSVARTRIKNEKVKLGDGNIAGKNLEAFDLIRYIISRQPVWIARRPNPRAEHYVKASNAFNKKPEPPADPFAVTPQMSPEEATHRRRLAYSASMIASIATEDDRW